MSAEYEEFRPELRFQFESKIHGLLSGEANTPGASGSRSNNLGAYQRVEITKIEHYGNGLEATAQVYFPGKVENLYLRTDSLAEKIIELSMGFPLPGTSPDETSETEDEEPKRRKRRKGTERN